MHHLRDELRNLAAIGGCMAGDAAATCPIYMCERALENNEPMGAGMHSAIHGKSLPGRKSGRVVNRLCVCEPPPERRTFVSLCPFVRCEAMRRIPHVCSCCAVYCQAFHSKVKWSRVSMMAENANHLAVRSPAITRHCATQAPATLSAAREPSAQPKTMATIMACCGQCDGVGDDRRRHSPQL